MRTAYVENRFEYRGFPCVVIFENWGYRLGCVGVPYGHPCYGVGYANIPVKCHGGLKYSGNAEYEQDDKNIWWIGFDCGGLGDGMDFECIRKYFSNGSKIAENLNDIKELQDEHRDFMKVYTQEDVENECRNIVDQLIEGGIE